MSATHNHLRQEVFDPDHCRACAANAGLLGHYRRVQWEEESRRDTAYSADLARRSARRSLWLSGAAIALIAVDLLVHL